MSEKDSILTWADIIESCSRLHTTRTRPMGPWPDADMREDSQMIDVLVDGHPVQIVPTRMHEPGFYWRWMDEMEVHEDGRSFPKTMRNPESIEILHTLADEGLVNRV